MLCGMQLMERVTLGVETEVEQVQISCAICHQSFAFGLGETAIVLKHIAYGYDYVHDGACLAAARDMIFVEPGYDRPAFSSDGQRKRILRTYEPEDWSAV